MVLNGSLPSPRGALPPRGSFMYIYIYVCLFICFYRISWSRQPHRRRRTVTTHGTRRRKAPQCGAREVWDGAVPKCRNGHRSSKTYPLCHSRIPKRNRPQTATPTPPSRHLRQHHQSCSKEPTLQIVIKDIQTHTLTQTHTHTHTRKPTAHTVTSLVARP